VSDKDIPTSGSRWEPADGASQEIATQPAETPAPTVPAEQAPTPTDDTAVMAERGATPVEDGTDHGRRARLPRRLRNRSALAAAGVGLVLAGGLGGFAVGHALIGTDGSEAGTTTGADQDGIPDGPPDGGRGRRPGFDRDGGGQDAPGTLPDGSTPDDSTSSPGDDEGGTS
jgi:hypothetical protein